MPHRIQRIILGALLPIPLMTLIFTIICDIFHFNKDPDYIRLADSTFTHICIDFLWYMMIGCIFFGIPSLFYSGILEWRRSKGSKYFQASWGLGMIFGLSVGAILIPSNQFGSQYLTEAFLHFSGVTLLLGLLIPRLLLCISVKPSPCEQNDTGNSTRPHSSP